MICVDVFEACETSFLLSYVDCDDDDGDGDGGTHGAYWNNKQYNVIYVSNSIYIYIYS